MGRRAFAALGFTVALVCMGCQTTVEEYTMPVPSGPAVPVDPRLTPP
jgi:hypothetical protein